MKKLLLSLAVVAMGFAASAQISVGAYGGLGLPMGDLSDGKYKMGFGGGIVGNYALNDNMTAGVNIGYYSFTNEASDDITMTSIPIMGTFNYYFTDEGFKPFVGAEVGISMVTSKFSLLGTTIEGSSSAFGFGLVGGAAYGLNDNMDVFAAVKYNSFSLGGDLTGTLAYLPINVGIVYKLGN